MKLIPRSLLVAACCVASAVADLPVHCLRHQVVGTWTFHLGEPSAKRTDCGHKHPDKEEAQPAERTIGLAARNVTVQLKEPSEAIVGVDGGNWTMVYDEGFEVDGGGLEFFAFSKFQLLPAQMRNFGGQTAILSECERTQVGWYRDAEKGQWGCFYGRKVPGKSAFAGVQRTVSMMPTSRSYLRPITASEMEEDVERINAGGSSWTAKVYSRFVGKSMKELNAFAGLQRSAVPKPVQQAGLVQQGVRQLRMQRGASEAWRKDFPKALDWRSVNGTSWLTDTIDQGDCGSCYVISTMRMLTARNRITQRNPKAEAFSVDFPLHCSEYNQGCKGGYPFLVTKWSRDVGVLPESCGSYNPEKGCSVTCDADKVNRFRAQSFSYLGGYYGGGTEQAMMKSLLEEGPLVVSLEPAHDFMYYSKGIYKSSPAKHSEWVKVDHSVLLVGWGEEKSEVDGSTQKYWIVQNSWGADWGEAGFFRIGRGDNDSGVEAEPLSGSTAEEKRPLEMSFASQS